MSTPTPYTAYIGPVRIRYSRHYSTMTGLYKIPKFYLWNWLILWFWIRYLETTVWSSMREIQQSTFGLWSTHPYWLWFTHLVTCIVSVSCTKIKKLQHPFSLTFFISILVFWTCNTGRLHIDDVITFITNQR